MPKLIEALDDVWMAALRLPDDEPAFDSLDPEQRRTAHDVAQRVQDRLMHTLARLTEGMAADGADLVDGGGVPVVMGASASPTAASLSAASPMATAPMATAPRGQGDGGSAGTGDGSGTESDQSK